MKNKKFKIIINTEEGMQGNEDIFSYKKNGNSINIINRKTGTKIRTTDEEDFNLEFPETIDMKITNYCDIGCEMCHEGSSIKGKHADLNPENNKFFYSLREGTELALGGGKVTSHPQLEEFLKFLKERGIIANITINEKEFLKNKKLILKLKNKGLINGLGISLFSPEKKIIKFAQKNRYVVLHLIVGIIDEILIEKLKNKNLKILFLGFKDIRRGKIFFSQNISVLSKKINYLRENILSFQENFNIISFDNLALKQLRIKEQIDSDIWNRYYMGDEGSASMYIDLIERKFAISSFDLEERFFIDSYEKIEEMFSIIKSIINKNFYVFKIKDLK